MFILLILFTVKNFYSCKIYISNIQLASNELPRWKEVRHIDKGTNDKNLKDKSPKNWRGRNEKKRKKKILKGALLSLSPRLSWVHTENVIVWIVESKRIDSLQVVDKVNLWTLHHPSSFHTSVFDIFISQSIRTILSIGLTVFYSSLMHQYVRLYIHMNHLNLYTH